MTNTGTSSSPAAGGTVGPVGEVDYSASEKWSHPAHEQHSEQDANGEARGDAPLAYTGTGDLTGASSCSSEQW